MTSEQQTQQAIAELADALIPPADGHLSGSDAGIPGDALAEAILARPDLAPVLTEAATTVATGTPAAELLRTWASDRQDDFDALFLLVRGAYFLNSEVRAKFHYDASEAHPLSDEIAPDYVDLVTEVIARGPRYRVA